jgi:hypothetical protein
MVASPAQLHERVALRPGGHGLLEAVAAVDVVVAFTLRSTITSSFVTVTG